jgi:hypothetical protein
MAGEWGETFVLFLYGKKRVLWRPTEVEREYAVGLS